MDFEYTEAQKSIRTMVREFVEKEVKPGELERFRSGKFDYGLYKRLGEVGISSMYFPEEWGGAGSDFLSWCLAREEISRVDPHLSGTLMVATSAARNVIQQGTEEQKKAWKDLILSVIKAEATASSAITEPGAGSDTYGIQTRAVLRNGKWVINGQKTYITNASLENNVFIVVLCVTGINEDGRKEFTNIFVPTNTPGVTRRPLKSMSRGEGLGEIFFDDCEVPAFNALGERGRGRLMTVRYGFATARVGVASSGLGIAEAAFEEALNYARQRLAFGRPISKFQFVQNMLVEMAVEKELSRLIRDKAAVAVDKGEPDLRLSGMAKYFCCESAKRATDMAIQIHGGLGLMEESKTSRLYLAVRYLTIADGTNEIQKYIIARELGC